MSIVRSIMLAAPVALFLLPQVARASLIYDEAVSGDIGNIFLGELDAGGNLINGSTVYGINIDEDSDAFQVAIPAGLSLQTVRLSVAFVRLPDEIDPNPAFPVGSAVLDGASLLLMESGSNEFLPPFSDDLISAAILGVSHAVPFPISASSQIAYQWEFVVTQAVPEPASIALFGVGLLGLAAAAFSNCSSPKLHRISRSKRP